MTHRHNITSEGDPGGCAKWAIIIVISVVLGLKACNESNEQRPAFHPADQQQVVE